MIPNITTQTLPQPPDQPTILINVGTNDPTRGDVAGWRGMARGMAQKIGARIVYADDKTVRAAFPDDKDSSYEALLARYIEEFNPPEAVFGSSCKDTLRILGQDPSDVYTVDRINEGVMSDLLGEQELVAHHLTPEDMKEEGEKFDAMHPTIKRPIITVMLMDPSGDSYRQEFAERIVKLMAHYPNATIYLCGSRHTSESNQDDLMKRIEDERTKQKLAHKIDVMSYKFDREAAYNPYKGLIARSKHIVVWGSSQSLVSEALYSGKTVYTYSTYGFEKVKKRKLVAGFNELALDHAPLSQEFEPVNLTDQLVEKLIEEKTKKDTEVDSRTLQRATANRSEEWDKHLRAIRRNHRAAALVPEELRQNPDFVRSAVSIRGFSLSCFPEYQENKDVVALAVGQNSHAVKFIGQALKGLRSFIEDLMNSVSCAAAFELADEKLRRDPLFVKMAMKMDSDIFEHVSEDLKNDPAFISEMLSEELISVYQVPDAVAKERSVLLQMCAIQPSTLQSHDKYINDPVFAAEAIALNPVCYKYFGYDVRIMDDIGVAAISGNYEMYMHVPDDKKGNKKFIVSYLQNGGAWQNIDMKYLDDDMMRDVIIAQPAAMVHASKALRNDRELARIVIEKDMDSFAEFSDEVRDDKSIIGKKIAQNPDYFSVAGPKTQDNFKTAKAAILHNPMMIRFCSERLQKNPSLIRSFVAKYPRSFSRLKPEARSLKGVEDVAVRKHPSNLAYCSEDYLNRPDVVENVIANSPHNFRLLGLKARSNPANIERIIKTGINDAISAIEPSALIESPSFFKKILDIADEDTQRSILSLVHPVEKFKASRRLLMLAIEKLPSYMGHFIDYHTAQNPDFMRKVASLPHVSASDIGTITFMSAACARAVLEVRPEFIEKMSIFDRAFPYSDFRSLNLEEQAKARDDLKFKPIKEMSAKVSGGVKSLKSAFSSAASLFNKAATAPEDAPASDPAKSIIPEDVANNLAKKLAAIPPEHTKFHITNTYISENYKKIDTLKLYKSYPSDMQTLSEPFLQMEYESKYDSGKFDKYKDRFASPRFNDTAVQPESPVPQFERDGIVYNYRTIVTRKNLGMDEGRPIESFDMSDHSFYPDGSVLMHTGRANNEIAVYVPETKALEHISDDGTICEHFLSLPQKHLEQVGPNVWIRANSSYEPVVMKDAVIGPAKPGMPEGTLGIYKRTTRKSIPDAKPAHGRSQTR